MSAQHKINVFFGTVIAICILAMTSQDLVTYAKAFFLSVIIGCLCIMRGLRDGVKKNHDSPSEETKEENQDNITSDNQKSGSPMEQRVTPEQVEEARKKQQEMYH